jgi:uncharacterized membrane protein
MTPDDSIYRPPESSLGVSIEAEGNFGSVERGVNGDFEFVIGDVLSEAWDLTNGSKGVLLGGLAVFYGVSIVFSLLSVAATGVETDSFDLQAQAGAFAVRSVGTIISYPIMAGIFLYAIKRASGDTSASFGDVLGQFDRFLPIVGLMLLQSLLVIVGIFFLVLPGIYLAVSYTLALPLLIEKDMGVWESLETSRRAISNCWFRCFGLMMVAGLIAGIGGLMTLGVGLIWFAPLAMLSFGVFYRNVFGFERRRAPYST